VKNKMNKNKEEVLDEIVSVSMENSDISKYGADVADILYKYKLIPASIYKTLLGIF
jgi:hypothetical protein